MAQVPSFPPGGLLRGHCDLSRMLFFSPPTRADPMALHTCWTAVDLQRKHTRTRQVGRSHAGKWEEPHQVVGGAMLGRQ